MEGDLVAQRVLGLHCHPLLLRLFCHRRRYPAFRSWPDPFGSDLVSMPGGAETRRARRYGGGGRLWPCRRRIALSRAQSCRSSFSLTVPADGSADIMTRQRRWRMQALSSRRSVIPATPPKTPREVTTCPSLAPVPRIWFAFSISCCKTGKTK